jgi:hypothetical protein
VSIAALPKRWNRLRPHKKQSQAWGCQERFVVLCCGRFSGKTEISRRRIVSYLPVKKEWDRPNYFYALPTYGQAKKVAWQQLLDLLPPHWLYRRPSDSSMVIETVFGSKLYVLGLDQPARVEGIEWDGCVIDESSDQKAGTFDRSVRPALAVRSGWCWRIGVPKRYGPGASEFKHAFELGQKGEGGYRSFTWPSWEVADKDEIESLREQLDAKDFEEQIGGSWVSAGGLAYHAFNRSINVKATRYDPTRPILVGSDFNVDPMAWVLGQLVPLKDGEKGIEIFDEIWLRNTNTKDTLDILWQRYGETHKGGWVFTGDASSKNRHTAASKSDYRQLLNDSRFQAKVRYDSSNPAVKDRVAAVNTLLKNAAGKTRLWVDDRCQHLILDLSNRSVDPTGAPMLAEGGTGRKDSGHATDALGYLVYKYFPIIVNQGDGPNLVVIHSGA